MWCNKSLLTILKSDEKSIFYLFKFKNLSYTQKVTRQDLEANPLKGQYAIIL